MKYDAVVVASGKGERSNLGFNKVFFVMKNGLTVLENACQTFIEDRDCSNIIVVTNDKDKVFNNNKVKIVSGGQRRQDSVINGLKEVKEEFVLIHDGARPFVLKEDIEKLKKEVLNTNAAILVSKSINTIKKVNNNIIEETIDRNVIYNALTPQAFKTDLIKDAYSKCNDETVTDDSLAVEKMGVKVHVVIGDESNIKLTNQKDFENI